ARATADLDGLPERVEIAVAERVPDVAVIEATSLTRDLAECGELLGGGIAAGRIVETGTQPDGALGHGIAERAAHPIEGGGVGMEVVPTERVDPQLAVPDERPDVDADRAVVAGEVVGQGAPVVVDVRTPIEPGVEMDERLEVLAPTERGKAVPVDA